MDLKPQLTPKLKALRLSGILETLDVRNRQAIEEKLAYVEFLERLLEDELERRGQKQLLLRLRRAAFNVEKTLEGFDWTFNPNVNRQEIYDLATCAWIGRKEAVLLVGPSGVGKSHLAQALGHEACRRGLDVGFTPVAKMLSALHGGRADGTYDRRLAGYLRPDLLILDDFGLRPLRGVEAEDFYEVVSERYERGSILITSNRDLGEWSEAFVDNPLLASAALDRLAHRAHQITITGASYRAKQQPRLGKD
ncbi:MAG: IS21-like element helper ATPase IstB [Candidatus Eisenbacteria bacterium]|nr:IS21-like element helper ATPase IstB [Candidatus Eisenbacteria bacterium]